MLTVACALVLLAESVSGGTPAKGSLKDSVSFASQTGGRFPPHRTHQNGLSVDIFMPVHDAESRHVVMPTAPWNKFGYSPEFDRNGRGEGLQIDFDSVAELLLEVHRQAGLHGLALERVIVTPEYVDRVLSAKAAGIRQLGPLFLRRPAWVRCYPGTECPTRMGSSR